MDLHIVGPEATAEEREAVDRLLGPPDTGWEGGARDIGRDGRTSRGRPAGRGGPAPPAAARVSCRAGPRGLGQSRRDELHLPAPRGAARRGVGCADLLSPVRHRAARRAPWRTSATTSRAGTRRRAAVRGVDVQRSGRPAPTRRVAGPRGCEARALGSASALRRCWCARERPAVARRGGTGFGRRRGRACARRRDRAAS